MNQKPIVSAGNIAAAVNHLSQLTSTAITAIGNSNSQVTLTGTCNQLRRSVEDIKTHMKLIYVRQQGLFRHVSGVASDALGDFPMAVIIPNPISDEIEDHNL